MPASNLRLVASTAMLLLSTLLLLRSAMVDGFQNQFVSRLSSIGRDARTCTAVFDSNNDENNEESISLPLSAPSSPSSQLERGNFNPLDYQRNTKSSRSSTSSAKVDIRSMRMSSLTNDLLNSLGDNGAMRSILEENRDFLLEPLETEDFLASSGSIYTQDMSRLERYQAYKSSVEERLQSSKNEKAKAILTAMKDYVLEFQNELPS